MEFVPQSLDAGCKVVDISADYRLRDAQIYEKWYGAKHTDTGHLAESVYGLPELFAEEIKGARLVANPGCYPTGAILGLAPLVSRGLIELEGIIIDAKSGISGAGRTPSPTLHFPECNESVAAYNVGVHRHTPEMNQILSEVAEKKVSVCFVPHIVPMDRGILSTIYVHLTKEISQSAMEDLFSDFYEDAPFVILRKDSLPATKDVWGTNFCHLALRSFGRRAVIISAIDNLIKGASGQAVENMNLMAGLKQTEGLL
jgi:N-acetyl-gamma-glutamyl-phosphate reductase